MPGSSGMQAVGLLAQASPCDIGGQRISRASSRKRVDALLAFS